LEPGKPEGEIETMKKQTIDFGVITRVAVVLTVSVILLGQSPVLNAQVRTGPPPGDSIPLDDAKREAIVDSICLALNETYIFLETAEKMEKHVRDKLKKGQYDNISSVQHFTDVLTQDLQEISHDLHLAVFYASPEELARMSPDRDPGDREREDLEAMARANFMFKKVEILPGNVGYLRFDQFVDATIAGPTAVAAMNFLANTDAVIFDLRQNGGGEPNLIQLLSSYLFDHSVHLNSFYVRKGDTTEQFWTSAYVDGPRMPDTDVYVLISNRTFSGAEEFSYNMKNLERGTLVGETTGGGAHPVTFVLYPDLNIRLKLPFGRAVNPISGTNWEGVGVVPDVEVPAELALDTAHLLALKKIREKETDEDRQFAIDWAILGLEAKTNPATVDDATLARYAGAYGPRNLVFENGVLYYQRDGRPRLRTIPLSDRLFTLDGVDMFRFEIVTDDSGQPVKLIGYYDNGFQDESLRSPGD
jgi:hypothetical protein